MEYSKKIDAKWQKEWKEKEVYKYHINSKNKKFYTLEMFSYPSGAKLHLGHWFIMHLQIPLRDLKKCKDIMFFILWDLMHLDSQQKTMQ